MAVPFQLAPDEEFLQCPYEPSHLITNLRFLVHLNKCRRNYTKKCAEEGKKVEMVSCRFNFLHQFPKPELDHHHRTCTDQYQVVKHIQFHNSEEFEKVKKEASEAEEQRQSTAQSSSGWDEEEEDWDKDSTGYKSGYDPSEKLKKEAILYLPGGLSKSERKAFRHENRKKFAQLDQADVKKPKVEYE